MSAFMWNQMRPRPLPRALYSSVACARSARLVLRRSLSGMMSKTVVALALLEEVAAFKAPVNRTS
jgi:hypothetical protein